jgi:hypothetical protein
MAIAREKKKYIGQVDEGKENKQNTKLVLERERGKLGQKTGILSLVR